MANAARGPTVGRPSQFANEEQRAVHSWSRIASAGHAVLLEAVKILSPTSRDLSSTEELVTFLQELSEEGHKPTVLRSKDVYGYRSSTTQPLTQDRLKPPARNVKPVAKKRRRVRVKKREVHPSWNVLRRGNPRIQGVPPPELLMDQRAILYNKTPVWTSEISQAPPVQSCLRLTNIKGLSGCHTARLQIQTTWDVPHKTLPAIVLQRPPPQALSGIPLQPSQNGAVALFSQKNLSCPVRLDGALIGDSAPVFHTNGRAFPQTHTELTSNGWGGDGLRRNGLSPKELTLPTRQRNRWRDKRRLRSKVVKVDDSRSVDEARWKAQKVLQVNLSPVIQIRPLNHVLSDFRYQN
ncbi:uncharacterized protein ccdc71 isoform X2 [Corythoichthys intestinalis]|nr:uncharacterized protein ccdc71 isoform X2 [Corythoichthys intestinalis]XP_057701193.1 uncharacterized protein ccdc71 isoform X2 [Corythoichthys intestinalis]XP_061813762.1 uncharacterized protein LOC133604526 [Nerophis lumbriciformis]